MPISKRTSRKTRNDPDGGFRINNELKPLIKRARDLGAAPSITQIAESNRFMNINKQTGASANMSFFRDFALCPELNPMGGPRITFTRASSATRVNQNGLIELMGTNVPRFDYNPVTRAAKGLLIEEARTNLFLRSEEIDNASWTKSAVSASANSVVSPDGLTTADTITENSTTAPHVVQQSPAIVNGTVYTLSFFAKAGSRSFVVATVSGSANAVAWFNLSTGTVGTIGGAAVTKSSTIQNFGNGWYRCMFVATGGATGLCSIGISTGDGTLTYAGNGTGAAYFWGTQIEAGSFATSYIPTTSATVTRAADLATITGNDFKAFFNRNRGTLFIEGVKNVATPATVQVGLHCGIVTSVLESRIALYEHDGVFIVSDSSGTAIASLTSTPRDVGVIFKHIGSYELNNFLSTMNGGTVLTDSSGTPPNPSLLYIGHRGGVAQLNGCVRKILLYGTAFSGTVLQSLTG